MARDQRRLAAIVSADVVGYSRLMGRDDSGTLASLKAHRRELIDPKIAEHGGRIVKTMGDGLPSAVPRRPGPGCTALSCLVYSRPRNGRLERRIRRYRENNRPTGNQISR